MIATVPSAWIEGLSATWLTVLLDTSIKGAVILSVAAVAAVGMRRMSAASRQVVWFLATAGLLVLPALSLMLPGWRILPDWAKIELQTGGQAEQPPAVVMVSQTSPDIKIAPPWPARAARAYAPAGQAEDMQGDPPAGPASAAPRASMPPPGAPAKSWQAKALPWAMGVWILGAAVALAPLVLGRLSLWAVRRSARPAMDNDWPELLDRAKVAIGLRRNVLLLVTRKPAMPMVWGLFSSRLLVPAEAKDWSPQRKWVVLLHELAHVKRWDCATKLLAHVACAVYWFNPLCWIAFRLMQKEAEAACDDLVLASGHEPCDYADHLLHIASGLRTGILSAHSSIAMARKSKLEGRLLAILDGRRNRRSLTRLGVLVAAVLAAAVAVPLAVLKATGPEKPVAAKPDEFATRPATQPATKPAATPATQPAPAERTLHRAQVPDTTGTTNVNTSLALSVSGLELELAQADAQLGLLRQQIQSGEIQNLPTVLQAMEMDPSLRALETGLLNMRARQPSMERKYGAQSQKYIEYVGSIDSMQKEAEARRKVLLETSVRSIVANTEANKAIILGRLAELRGKCAAKAQTGEYYVMGEVDRPGVYSLTGREITVKMALAAAGFPLGKKPGMAVVLVRRKDDGTERRQTLNVDALVAGTGQDIVLQPNDLLMVMPGKQVAVRPVATNEASTRPAATDGPGAPAPGNGADNKARVVRRVYDVRDLVIAIPSYTGRPAYWDGIDGNMGFILGSEPGSAESRALQNKTIERENEAQLIEKIKRIDPGSWLPEAGIGSITPLQDGKNLVISQTPENHAQISKLIEMLRDERSLQVLISFKFIHWSGSQAAGKSDALPAWLSKNVKSTFDEKTGLLRMSDSEAEALLEHVKSKADYTLLSAPRITLYNRKRASVTVRRDEAIFLPRLDKKGEKALMQIPTGAVVDIQTVVDRKGKSIVCDLATCLAERAFQADVPGVAVAEAKAAFTVPDKAAMLLRVEMVKHKIEGARQAVGQDGAAKMEIQHSPVETGGREKDFVYILISSRIIERAEAETQPVMDMPMYMPPAPAGAGTQPATQPTPPPATQPAAKDKAGGAKDEIARVYDIRDLIVPRQRYYPLVVGWLDSDAEKATEVSSAAPTAKEMREDLKDRIIKSVDKASWKEAGGQGAMKDLDYALVITQTAGNQKKITKVIEDLRRERSRWMQVEAKVITASPDAAGRLEDWLKKSGQLTFQKGQPGIFLSAADANSFLNKAQSFADVQVAGFPRRYFFLSIVHGRTNTSMDTKGYRFELPDLNQPGKSDKVFYTAGMSVDIQGAVSPDGNDITMTFTVSTARLTREVMPVEAAAANAHATISISDGHAFIAKAPLVQRQVKGFRRQKDPGSGEFRTTVVEEPIPGRKPVGEVYVLIKPSIVHVQDVQERDESEYVEEPRREP